MNEKKFKLFDFNKDGKGVSKHESDGPPNLIGFFKQYKRKFGRLISVNILYVLGCFPLFFLGFYFAGYGAIKSSVHMDTLFPIVDALSKLSPSPVTDSLSAVFALPSTLTVNTTLSLVFCGLSLLILFTWGLTNVGCTYILRNFCKGDPVFAFSDFWYAIKRNVRQGIIIGIIDILASGLLMFNVSFYFARIDGTFLAGIMFYISLAMLIIFFFMRFYMYILLVTFDLSIFKILKNSLIFSILGFKRNFMAALGIVVLVVLNLMVFFFVQPLGIVLPLVLTVANGAFMSTYAAWFKIKEIMIDPYAEESDEEFEPPIAVDDVTE